MLAVVFIVVASIVATLAYDNGVSYTPPMGWTTWCTNDICGLRDRCSEFEVRKRVDAMATNGMFELGYKWILLDDCWSDHERDANGELQPNPYQFPSGMRALSAYVHKHGMKLGLYTCVGTETCKKNRPGSYGHFEQDAKTMASWQVDMVKADYCHRPGNETGRDLYTQFSKALNATGHPMLFAMCQWGEDEVWDWAPEIAQVYRIQMDHIPFWQFPPKAAGVGYGQGTKEIIDFMADLHPSKYNKPNQWMDPDFLETLENPITLNYTNSRTEFAFWAMWSSPLMIATDVDELTDKKRAIFTNSEVLAVHQDVLFVSGERLYNLTNGAQAWYRPLSNGDTAVILYNSDNFQTLDVSVSFAEVPGIMSADVSMRVRNLWDHKDMGEFTGSYTAMNVAVHDHEMLRFSPVATADMKKKLMV